MWQEGYNKEREVVDFELFLVIFIGVQECKEFKSYVVFYINRCKGYLSRWGEGFLSFDEDSKEEKVKSKFYVQEVVERICVSGEGYVFSLVVILEGIGGYSFSENGFYIYSQVRYLQRVFQCFQYCDARGFFYQGRFFQSGFDVSFGDRRGIFGGVDVDGQQCQFGYLEQGRKAASDIYCFVLFSS